MKKQKERKRANKEGKKKGEKKESRDQITLINKREDTKPKIIRSGPSSRTSFDQSEQRCNLQDFEETKSAESF